MMWLFLFNILLATSVECEDASEFADSRPSVEIPQASTTPGRNADNEDDNRTLVLVLGIAIPIVVIVVVVSITGVMCYEMAVRWGCHLVGPREVTFSSSEAVTYNRPDRGHKVPYTSHTDTPATTPQRRPHNHYEEECSRTYELTSSYVDPADNVVNRPLLLPGGPKPNGGVRPKYEEPSCISGSGPGSRQTSRQYSTGYSTVFQIAGTYVPTLEERVFVDGRYETQHSMKHQYNKLCFFPEDNVYWAPAATASGLYAQLSAKRYREIPREQLRQETLEISKKLNGMFQYIIIGAEC
jgi:hypothetical protein